MGIPAIGYSAQDVPIYWKFNGKEQALGSWNLSAGQPKSVKKGSSRERDPESNAVVSWEGVVFQDLLEKAMDALTVEERATVDLVFVQNGQGRQAWIPRSLLSRYPLLVAVKKAGGVLSSPQIVIPWTSRAKIQDEALPLETYFLADVSRIELANYRDKYGTYYLKRRTDPSAMRGEKVFVETCVACHGSGRGPAVSDFYLPGRLSILSTSGHPVVKGNPRLSERDQRAILSYLSAFQLENPGKGITAQQGAKP